MACCGLNVGFGGPALFPVLLSPALLLWPLHFGYSRLVHVPVTWWGSLLSSIGYVLFGLLVLLMSLSMNRQSGLLMIVMLILFLIGYGIVYRFAHQANVLKGLGYAVLGVVVYVGTVLLLSILFEI